MDSRTSSMTEMEAARMLRLECAAAREESRKTVVASRRDREKRAENAPAQLDRYRMFAE